MNRIKLINNMATIESIRNTEEKLINKAKETYDTVQKQKYGDGLVNSVLNDNNKMSVYYKELSQTEIELFLIKIGVPSDIISIYLNYGRRRKRKVRT